MSVHNIVGKSIEAAATAKVLIVVVAWAPLLGILTTLVVFIANIAKAWNEAGKAVKRADELMRKLRRKQK